MLLFEGGRGNQNRGDDGQRGRGHHDGTRGRGQQQGAWGGGGQRGGLNQQQHSQPYQGLIIVT